jgi:two-component system NarL family response regulator
MNAAKPIRVLIIDDHRMLREALRILLEKEDGIQLAGEAGDELEGIEVAVRTRPEVILLDIGMHGIGGIQTAHRLRHEVPRSRVLMLTQYDDEEYVLEALGEAEVAGYLIKSDAASELVGAIRAVAAGKRYISPAVAPVVLERVRGNIRPAGRDNGVLTKREREILSLIAQGAGAKAIAGKLGISPKTVQVHRSNLAAKLRLSSTAAIVRYAIKHKLMKLD